MPATANALTAVPAASASPTVCTSASSKLRELEWDAGAEPRALEFSSLRLSREDFGSSARLLAPETPPEPLAQASAAADCQWQSMAEGAVLEFRRDAAAIVREFLELDAFPLPSSPLPLQVERSLPSSARGFRPASAAGCASEQCGGFGEPWNDNESSTTTNLPSTTNGDPWLSLSSTFPGAERSGFRQSHAEFEAYAGEARSPDVQSSDFGQWHADFDLHAGDKHPPGEHSSGATLKDAYSPDGVDQPRSPRVDDTMDEVTRHLMHARDKIEAVELEFAQIMNELANYGERWGDGSGTSKAWEEPQAGLTEYFCINTPQPNKPGLFAFPPTGFPVEVPCPLETSKLAPALPE